MHVTHIVAVKYKQHCNKTFVFTELTDCMHVTHIRQPNTKTIRDMAA